jgi:GT2 family glycosyltransferase
MSAPGPASVIVVSRHRAAELRRCLVGLGQQDHPCFEVIVVADPAGAAAVADLAVKRVVFDQANISAARNLGLAQAASPVVAFIDDDAVAEPTWLSRLVAPFQDDSVSQATGFVRGRNGISFQWRACEVDAQGQDHPIRVPDTVTLHRGNGQRAVKTQGTNCAFRTAELQAIGGFDPAFRFYLDEADVNLRLAARGGLTAIVPMAQVHHGFAASARRRADRVPLDLHEIAASTAVFLRRHASAPAGLPVAVLARERGRAIAHMVAGRIEPRDVRRLLASLRAGWAEGMVRPLPVLDPAPSAGTAFLRLPDTGPRPGLLLCGGAKDRTRLAAQARQAVDGGRIVTVICLERSLRPHWHGFRPEGFWWQQGGLFGRSDRGAPVLRFARPESRAAEETERIIAYRPIGGVLA